MAAVAFALAAIFSVLLWLVSWVFRPRLDSRERVVMQWSLTGKPTSNASPGVALTLTPATGTISLFAIAALVSYATPPNGRGSAVAAIVGVGVVLIAIHAAHMWFAARSGEC